MLGYRVTPPQASPRPLSHDRLARVASDARDEELLRGLRVVCKGRHVSWKSVRRRQRDSRRGPPIRTVKASSPAPGSFSRPI